MTSAAADAHTGFRRLCVTRRVRESESIVSFELAPTDGMALAPFRAGQFVAVRLALPDGESLIRTYSLSGDPAERSRWRISVKQETNPRGRGSCHLHERAAVGDVLEIAGPAGAFVCAEDSDRPVVLLSGGVGVTPMLSMLHRLSSASTRRVHFIHACENGAVHAFREEVQRLAAMRAGIGVHVCYRLPRDDEDRDAFDSRGLLTKETLQALLPLDDYEVYLCGPPPFMQANWNLLRNLGVARERIHYEFFGPATVIDGDVSPPATASESSQPVDGEAITVRFHPHGEPVAWNPACASLLEFAEQCGHAAPFSCRAGICNSCITRLVAGRVDYAEPPLDPPADGELLLCCARPVTSVTLALQSA
ncbi:oxidoreductase FAD/NAD(P)-binding subunit [Caballeronia hypogeia]|uniref:nitric oxide dioxygenase n=1 Tax=Caballeronia hypogeia TaxID=1777140 RepID=A0A158A7M6_9BURK|nr:2Fe-2S iron-sulfur cluster-binding protein [Caballeronia hypogeia]SAK53770.1 oxidoreductase FAD/NAD(P)-binding subunit [Caballeronia hypogeia]